MGARGAVSGRVVVPGANISALVNVFDAPAGSARRTM